MGSTLILQSRAIDLNQSIVVEVCVFKGAYKFSASCTRDSICAEFARMLPSLLLQGAVRKYRALALSEICGCEREAGISSRGFITRSAGSVDGFLEDVMSSNFS